MNRRNQVYQRYYESDIFNNNPAHLSMTVEPPKITLNANYHPTFENTKEDVFNISKTQRIKRDKEITPIERSQSAIRRRKIYDGVYGSDIFNRQRAHSTERRRFGGIDRDKKRNISNCFEEMKNDEEYVKDLKEYQGEHRVPKKEYNADIYIDRETAQDRYYRDHYDCHGLVVLPESNYDTEQNNELYRRLNYSEKKRRLRKDMEIYNNVGADQKHPGGNSAMYPKDEDLTNRFGKKKWGWPENKGNRRYVDPRDNHMNSCQINRQIYLTSDALKNIPEGNFEDEVELINNRIEQEKKKKYKVDVLGNPIRYYTKNNDENANDRSLIGAVHTRWGRTNIHWTNPDAELMFINENNDVNKKKYGEKGPTPFQRKINQLADSKNYDTISGTRNAIPIQYIQKPLKTEKINGSARKRMDDMVMTLPNLDDGKKLEIRMRLSTLDLNNEEDMENKEKTVKDFYCQPKRAKRDKNYVTAKVNERKDKNELNQKHLNDIDFHDYTLTYGTRGKKFEKYDESDIKKLFGVNGIPIYDVQKNPFDKGDYNIVKFKVRYLDNKSRDEVNEKIKKLQDDLNKKNLKVKIERGGEKNFKKNERNIECKPGDKTGVIMDSGYNSGYKGPSAQFKLIPNHIRKKHGFSKEFANVNYTYKKFNP